ncbi:MAG: hypothetical protein WCF67_23740 [Chitinophagaceae bacterium]
MGLLLLAVVVRPVTVILHELGHAIPALLLTQKKVSVYIGSHGDTTKSVHFKLGLLEFWFKYNPVLWQYGLCYPHAPEISLRRQFIYILTGPLTSTTIAVVACYFSFAYDLHGALKLLLIVFLGSSIFDFFINIVPNNTPYVLANGIVTYNDGYLLSRMLSFRKIDREFSRANKAYAARDFATAAKLVDDLLSKDFHYENIYRLGIGAHTMLKNYDKALKLHDALAADFKLNADDYYNLGLIKAYLDHRDESLEAFSESISLNPNNSWTFNNRGYFLTVWNRFEESMPDFDKAIALDAEFAYAYNNRGLAKIKTGAVEAGLEDINHSLQLDPGNAYAWRNLGIYFLAKENKAEALKNFEQARALNADTLLVEELIKQAKEA